MIDLVGHTLNAVVFNSEEQTLSLTVDGDKIFLLRVEGDCCSTGKFLGVKDSYDLPAKITAQHDRSESFQDGEYQVYETVLELENGGKITINYDNESNGYYGSTLDAYYNGERLWDFPVEEAKNVG